MDNLFYGKLILQNDLYAKIYIMFHFTANSMPKLYVVVK